MAAAPTVTGYPLSGTLACAAPDVPPALVSPAALDRVLQVARCLPAALTSLYGFECRLGEASASADFAFAVRHPAERRILAGFSPAELPRSLWDHPDWRRVRDLSAGWLDPALVLEREVKEIWLEFDLHDAVSYPPVPSVFVGLTRPGPNPEISPAFRPAVARALALLWPEGLPEPLCDRLHACIAALPPEGSLRQVGMMLSRSTGRVRLYASLPKEGVVEYLTRVGWRGPAAELAATVAWLSRYVDRVLLSFDVGATIGQRVGIEGQFDNIWTASREGRWRPLLDALAQRGLCTAAKREALLAWHGVAWHRLPHELWMTMMVRLIDHVKLVHQPDRDLEAKAYVGFVQPREGTDDGRSGDGSYRSGSATDRAGVAG